MAKRRVQKDQPTDGLGPRELKQIHKAVRQVWSWSRAHRIAKARATDKNGFPRCEKCKKRVPKLQVDHISNVGEVGGPNYIKRMFVPSDRLQCLCKKCHDPKTKAERAKKRPIKGFL